MLGWGQLDKLRHDAKGDRHDLAGYIPQHLGYKVGVQASADKEHAHLVDQFA